jgi:hypothetical protein
MFFFRNRQFLEQGRYAVTNFKIGKKKIYKPLFLFFLAPGSWQSRLENEGSGSGAHVNGE